MNLLLSTLALLAGPFVYALGRRNAATERLLNVVIVAAIAWIVGVHILPEAIEATGWPAAVALLAGMAFPFLLRRVFHLAAKTAHIALLALAALALILHALIDGIALSPAGGDQLAVAVIIHRVPVGMAIWWTFRPAIGTTAAIVAFGLLIAATAAAYLLGAPVAELAENRILALFQAFVAGSLVDLVIITIRDRLLRGR
ncbi:MAG: hypothetical protein QNJ14_10895 [Woeseiaceae bacterium]|nr:hypothetical protein [Woeseiaceae bacterium]